MSPKEAVEYLEAMGFKPSLQSNGVNFLQEVAERFWNLKRQLAEAGEATAMEVVAHVGVEQLQVGSVLVFRSDDVSEDDVARVRQAIKRARPDLDRVAIFCVGSDTEFESMSRADCQKLIGLLRQAIGDDREPLRAALKRARDGYAVLIELNALPHDGWDAEARKYVAEMDAALAESA